MSDGVYREAVFIVPYTHTQYPGLTNSTVHSQFIYKAYLAGITNLLMDCFPWL